MIAPPVRESMRFRSIAYSVEGPLLSGLMVAFRRWIDGRIVVAVIVVAIVVGGGRYSVSSIIAPSVWLRSARSAGDPRRRS